MDKEARLIYCMKRILIYMKRNGTTYNVVRLNSEDVDLAIDLLIKMGLLAGGHGKPYLTDKGDLLLFDLWTDRFDKGLVEMYEQYVVERHLLGVID